MEGEDCPRHSFVDRRLLKDIVQQANVEKNLVYRGMTVKNINKYCINDRLIMIKLFY